MKYLFVTYALSGGGAEKVMQELASHYHESGHEVHIAYFVDGSIRPGALPQDVVVHNVSTHLRPATPFLTVHLLRLVLRLHPDILASFLWPANIIAYAATRLSGFKGRVFLTEHTQPSRSIRRYSFPRMRGFLTRIAYSGATTVIAVSQGAADDLIANFSVPREKVRVINNGVNLAEIQKLLSDQIRLPVSQPFIAHLGRLEPSKNIDLLIEGFAIVARERPDVSLLVIGDGTSRNTLEKKVQALALTDRVFFFGNIVRPYPYLAQAEAFAMTSDYEGFGIVILEAMACHVPVVVTRCSGSIEAIVPAGKGIVIDRGDVQALAHALLRLLSDRRYAREIADSGFKHVSENFTLEHMLAEYDATMR